MKPKKGFQKGNKLASGGIRPGAGRPSDWLKQRCQDVVVKKDLIGIISKIASGEDFQATRKDQLHAVEILLDRGFGKPNQTMEVKQIDTPCFGFMPAGAISQILEAIEKRGD
jgi:hypothetical protein